MLRKKLCFVNLGVLLGALLVSMNAEGGVNSWTNIGPEGGSIVALAIDPITPSTLYAGTSGAGVFKSTNGGASWRAVNTGLTNLSVGVLTIDPQTPATLYMAPSTGFDGVFKSTDGGLTWSAANTGLTDSPYSAPRVTALAIAPQIPATLYAATLGPSGVFKSTNGGESWSQVNIDNLQEARALAIDPQTSATLYAATYNGVFKSTDGGARWSAVNTGLPDFKDMLSLAIDPQIPATLYAGTFGDVFKSTDGGASWSDTGLPNPGMVRALAIDPQMPATLYAATGIGVFKSTNSAGSWSAANTGLSGYSSALAIDPQTPATLYAGTSYGVFKSANGAGNWSAVNTGITAKSVSALAIDLRMSATLYAGTDSGIFKSTNGGGSWSAATNSPAGASALVIDPVMPTTLYSGGSGGLFKSIDGGGSWIRLSLSFPVYDLAIDPVTPTTIYAGTFYGFHKSIDGGVTWRMTFNGAFNHDVPAVTVDPVTPTTLYAGTNNGVYKSTNGGESWFAVNTGLPLNPNCGPCVGLPVRTLAINPQVSLTLYAGTNNGVYKSTNGGGSWSAFNTGLPSGVRDIVIDPVTPDTLYASTGYGSYGVFKSTDGGVSWSAFNEGLTNLSVWALAIDPQTPTTLYAGTNGGVFVFNGGGSALVAAFTYSPSNPVTGSPVSFDGSSSTCVASPCSYIWSDDADGSLLGTGVRMSFTFRDPGTKYVRLTITDTALRRASIEHDVIVSPSNSAPAAAFTFSPSNPVTGSPVSFDGSSSTCAASPCSYRWTDDADGSVLGTGVRMSFTFRDSGTKYVRLTITDAQSRTASVEHDVIVAPSNNPLVAAFTYSPSNPVTRSPVSFDASSSTCAASPCSYVWTDDADSSLLGTGVRMSFTFRDPGIKYVRLTITDAQSRTASVEHDVTVSP